MFTFFLKSNRSGILGFCGSQTEVKFDPSGDEGKFCFRKLENGQYKDGEIPVTRHPNILRSVMIGKKSLGLWIDQWSDGIVEGSFTFEEIMQEFIDRNIVMPKPFQLDFQNRIRKKRDTRIQKEIERLHSGGMWK
jgi:hypothetical protein